MNSSQKPNRSGGGPGESKGKNKFDHLMQFLYTSDIGSPSVPPAELASDLENQGVNVAQYESSVARILTRSADSNPHAWLERARVKRRWFEDQVRRRTEELTRKYRDTQELLAAMMAGQLGTRVQAQAGVFFRNKKPSELSPQDLKTLIEDCQLIDLIPEDFEEGSLPGEPDGSDSAADSKSDSTKKKKK